MDFNLKGGALLIGSLFWQDDRNEEQGKRGRKIWRDNTLKMDKVIDISVPIRYGRFSGKPELNNQTYTMIFDNTLPVHQFGIAKAVPFKKDNFATTSDIILEALQMSTVEGRYCDYFVKTLISDCAWCIISIIFNPHSVRDNIKSIILQQWKAEMLKNKSGHDLFLHEYAQYSLKATGELDIPWPKEADGFNFLLSASTRPRFRKEVNFLDEAEIARFIHQREYFETNKKLGIITYQDENISEKALEFEHQTEIDEVKSGNNSI
ncbi:MAG TPA: hypothetical protein VK921_03730 [Anditalea sp.]|nr:hypothetical protein [Anditalea sp.]